jgi:transcriptional regulator with XRE-family HTH domain
MKLTLLELYRRAQGLSQAALAERLGPGFTASAISLLESQRLKPSRRQERRLREVFGDQAEALLKPVDPARVVAPIGEAP